MRKALLAGVLAVMMLTSTALAEVYEGTTVAASSLNVEAAASGILRELSAETGCAVSEGEVLADISTTKVFAAQDGTVARIHASEGESAEDTILEVYPLEQYEIYCTVENAYQSAESTLVHGGESVYIKCTTDGSHRGTGVINQIDGDEYRVLATGGEFYVGETVYLYRDEDFSSKQRIGIGTVITSEVQSYTADGTIIRMHVEEGEYIERGELLFEYADADKTASVAEADEIVTEIFAGKGELVEKGETLMTLVPYDQILVEIQVSETDAGMIREGGRAELVYSMDPTETPVTGTIKSISYIAEDELYAVRVLPDTSRYKRLGLTVTVRFEDE